MTDIQKFRQSRRAMPLAPGQAGFTSAPGAGEPQKLSWYAQKAYRMQPCASLCSERLSIGQAVLATLFTSSGDPQPSPSNGGNLAVTLEQGQ